MHAMPADAAQPSGALGLSDEHWSTGICVAITLESFSVFHDTIAINHGNEPGTRLVKRKLRADSSTGALS